MNWKEWLERENDRFRAEEEKEREGEEETDICLGERGME